IHLDVIGKYSDVKPLQHEAHTWGVESPLAHPASSSPRALVLHGPETFPTPRSLVTLIDVVTTRNDRALELHRVVYLRVAVDGLPALTIRRLQLHDEGQVDGQR